MLRKTAVLLTFAAVASPLGTTTGFAMANPASVFCEEMGGKSVIATLPGGDQIGLCYLPGNKIVEEWTLFRMFDGKKPANDKNPFHAG